MNQTEQMREALQGVRRDIESLTALQNGTVNHIVKGACGTLDRVLQALKAEPAPLVRLTDEEIAALYVEADAFLMLCDEYEFKAVARAIMEAMIKKNGGSHGM